MNHDQIQLFEDQPIRTAWDAEREEWYFSVVDVVRVLTEQPDYDGARNYWKVLKYRLKKEGSQLVTACNQLSMKSPKDGKRYKSTSGGQQQRVSIGRALMNAPAVVLADEPTGNRDSRNSQEIVELLRQSNVKYKQTLIVITHDDSIALQADRIIAIEDGRIVRDERIRGGAK